MSKLTLFKGLLLNLEQKIPKEQKRIYLTRDKALDILKSRTGQDFGYDVVAWKKWLKDNKLR